MGDPVGPERAATELAWTLRELADHHGGWACFYQVGPTALPRYLDMGLALFRLGEEAIVDLAGFSLEGGPRRPLRTPYHRAERDGLSFEVVPAGGGRAAAARAARHLRRLARREEGEGEGVLGRRLRRPLPVRGAARRRAARRPDRGVREPVGPGEPRGALLRPHAPRARRAERDDGLPVRLDHALGEGPGVPQLQPRHGAALGARGPDAGAALDQGRRPASSATASTSTTSRGCASTRRSSSPSGAPATSRRPAACACRSCSRTSPRSSLAG